MTICGASLKNELLVEIVDARDETPDRWLEAYGVLGGTRNEEGASEMGRERSNRISISGPLWGLTGCPDDA